MRHLTPFEKLAHAVTLGMTPVMMLASFCQFEGGEPFSGFLFAAATIACLGTAVTLEIGE